MGTRVILLKCHKIKSLGIHSWSLWKKRVCYDKRNCRWKLKGRKGLGTVIGIGIEIGLRIGICRRPGIGKEKSRIKRKDEG